jgi:hypothetical protein
MCGRVGRVHRGKTPRDSRVSEDLARTDSAALASYERSGHFRSEMHFRSSDFMPRGPFEGERGVLLAQPLLFEHEPLGILTLPLGEQHRTVYEEMRDVERLSGGPEPRSCCAIGRPGYVWMQCNTNGT